MNQAIFALIHTEIKTLIDRPSARSYQGSSGPKPPTSSSLELLARKHVDLKEEIAKRKRALETQHRRLSILLENESPGVREKHWSKFGKNSIFRPALDANEELIQSLERAEMTGVLKKPSEIYMDN